MVNSIIKDIFSSPSKTLMVFIVICLFFCLPYSTALLLFTFIGYGWGLGLGLCGVRAVALGFVAWLGLFIPLGHLLAKAGIYGKYSLALILMIACIAAFWTIFKTKKPKNFLPEKELSKQALKLTWPLMLVVFCLFLFTRLFWLTTNYNASPPTIMQMALYMIREGKLHFLTPAQDVYENFSFWYPNLLAHLTAAGLVFLEATAENVMKFGALLGSYLIVLACVAWLDFFSRNQRQTIITAWSLIAVFCSYAWFRISVDFSTDTIAFLLVAAFFGWLVVFLQKQDQKSFLGLVFSFVAVCWFRQFAGPITLIAGLFLLLFFYQWRALFLGIFKKIKFSFIVLISVLILSGFWYFDVFRITGQPFYPFNSRHLAVKIKTVWPHPHPLDAGACFKDGCAKSSLPSAQEAKDNKFKRLYNPAYGLLYSLFSLDQQAYDQGKLVPKFFRGFVFGYTLPTTITFLFIIGLLFYLVGLIKHTKIDPFGQLDELVAFEQIAFAFMLGVLVFVYLSSFYYKLLYLALPAILVFVYRGLTPFRAKAYLTPLFYCLMIVQIFLFLFLLSYKCLGTTNSSWALLRYLMKKDLSAYDEIKAYNTYQAALRARSRLQGKDYQMMHFHGEPGMETSLFLDRGYFWQEQAYNNCQSQMDLYRADNPQAVIKLLKEKNIKVLNADGINFFSASSQCGVKHLLPKMLAEKHEAFDYDLPFVYLKE